MDTRSKVVVLVCALVVLVYLLWTLWPPTLRESVERDDYGEEVIWYDPPPYCTDEDIKFAESRGVTVWCQIRE